MDELNFLSEVSIFSHLKNKDLKKIAKLATQQSFKAGEVVVREGERDGRLYILAHGEAEVIKGLGGSTEWRLRTLGPRSYFGEMALIDDWVRTASVVAKTDLSVLFLDRWNLRKEIENYPIMAVELLQMLSRRVKLLENSLIDTLVAFLPLCDHCHSKHSECSVDEPSEKGMSEFSESLLSHILCDECAKTLYSRLHTSPSPVKKD